MFICVTADVDSKAVDWVVCVWKRKRKHMCSFAGLFSVLTINCCVNLMPVSVQPKRKGGFLRMIFAAILKIEGMIDDKI